MREEAVKKWKIINEFAYIYMGERGLSPMYTKLKSETGIGLLL